MRYILQRLLWLPVVLWAVASLTFVALRLTRGSAADTLAMLNLPAEAVASFRAQWGLDKPLSEQYLAFIGDLVRGDFGVSMQSAIPVSRLIYERLPPTIELAVVAMVLSTLLGVGAGVISSVSRGKLIDVFVRAGSLLGLSVPWFWIAIVLIVVFSVRLDLMPVAGRIDSRLDYERITNFMFIDLIITGNWRALGSFLHHLTLPALAIGLTSSGYVARLTRAAMLEVLRTDYVRTARSKGLGSRTVTLKHAFRSALLPILTFQGLQFGTLLGGAVITEMVFAWPGMGRLLLDGIMRRDYPVVQASVIVVASIYVVVNLVIDLLYHVVDPRLRR
jgi:peptide/nickel transport system permease protein